MDAPREEWIQDWFASCVDPAVTALNVEPCTGDLAFEKIFGRSAQRRNDGRLRDRWLRKYRHWQTLGGWWCSGVDPQTGERREWGRFRVMEGELIDAQKGKRQRYVSPAWGPGSSCATFLRVPDHTWEKVSRRYGVPITDADRAHPAGFWAWVKAHVQIPVVPAEGEKKAGAILSQGFVPIALPGIWMGMRKKDDTVALIPDLAFYDDPGREVIFLFDYEAEARKRKIVRTAISRTGSCFRHASVSVAELPGPQKGVDDFVAAGGDLEAAIDRRQPLDAWRSQELWGLSAAADVTVNSRYFPPETVQHIPAAGNAALVGEMGCGKTELFAQIAKANSHEGRRTYVVSPRRALGRELCKRLGLPWVTEADRAPEGRVLGFGLCYDSFRPDCQGRVRGAELVGDAILDEPEQGVTHLLTSATCADKRLQILREFSEFGESCKQGKSRLLVGDAHLSDPILEFLTDLCGPVKIIKNDWKPEDDGLEWNVRFFYSPDPAIMFEWQCRQIERGLRPLWLCDSQKTKSKYGTQNVESLLRKRFPGKKFLRFDSETQTDPNHPAYGSAGRINELLAEGEWDAVIASTSISTGVSIDLKGYFTGGLFACFQGVVSANEIIQAMARVRDCTVPRFAWVRKQGVGKIGNGGISVAAVIRGLDREWKCNASLLGVDAALGQETPGLKSAIRAYAKLAARFNAGQRQLREAVRRKLVEAGHTVTPVTEQDYDREEAKEMSRAISANRDALWDAQAQATSEAPEITATEFKALQKKESRTEGERRNEEKFFLNQRYRVPVTPVLKKLNDCKWYGKARLHYLLIANSAVVRHRDRKHLSAAAESGSGKVFLPDLRLQSTRVAALKALKIEQFLESGREWGADSPEVVEFYAALTAYRVDLENLFGLRFASIPPMRCLQNILGLLGVKLLSRQLRVRGDAKRRERLYRFEGTPSLKLEAEAPGLRDAVFAAWAAADAASMEREETMAI